MKPTIGRDHRPTPSGAKVFIVALMAVSALFASSACGPRPDSLESAGYDGPVYETFDDLRTASDIVVLGKVVGDPTTVRDAGGEPDDGGQAIAQEASIVRVANYLQGSGPDEILVIQPSGKSEDSTVLEAGQEVVLWLKEETAESAPSVFGQIGQHWSPLGLDQGIADVSGGNVQPRNRLIESTSLQDLASKLDG